MTEKHIQILKFLFGEDVLYYRSINHSAFNIIEFTVFNLNGFRCGFPQNWCSKNCRKKRYKFHVILFILFKIALGKWIRAID